MQIDNIDEEYAPDSVMDDSLLNNDPQPVSDERPPASSTLSKSDDNDINFVSLSSDSGGVDDAGGGSSMFSIDDGAGALDAPPDLSAFGEGMAFWSAHRTKIQ